MSMETETMMGTPALEYVREKYGQFWEEYANKYHANPLEDIKKLMTGETELPSGAELTPEQKEQYGTLALNMSSILQMLIYEE